MVDRTIAGTLMVLGLLMTPARADDPTLWFDEAVQYDLKGETAPLAFALYQRAAAAGLPQAEFNVAVMLDSGRGVKPDVKQAALWYARAASHGERRAAYNLGQLYELGEGVPRNVLLARAWFAASDLPAARERLTALAPYRAEAETLSSPTLVAPVGVTPRNRTGGIELVWTSLPQPESVRFFVELRAAGDAPGQEIFAGFVDTSSVFVTIKTMGGSYVWRVLAVAQTAGQYTASDWQQFEISSAEARIPTADLP